MNPEIGRHNPVNTPLVAGYRLRSLIQEGHQLVNQLDENPRLDLPSVRQARRRAGRLEADLGLLIIQLDGLRNQDREQTDSGSKPDRTG